MFHLLFTVVVFVAVMGMAVVLFSGWVVVSIVRLFARLFQPPRGMPVSSTGPGRACPNPLCRSSNPVLARFCRRCGSGLEQRTPQAAVPVPRRPLHAVQ